MALIKLKPWRFVAAMLLGFALGFGAGAWFQAKVLAEPTTVVEIGKQKVRGRENSGTFENKPEVTNEENKGWWIFGKQKNKEDKQ